MRAVPVLAMLGLFFSALPGHAATLSGEWTVSSPSWGLPHVCTFRQAGGSLTGSCSGPHAQGDVRGAIQGQGVGFNWQAGRFNDHAVVTWRFSGRIEADVIRGTLVRGRMHTTFIARRPVGLS